MTKKTEISRDVIELRRPFRTAQSPRVPVILEFPGESRTKQQFKDECDINNIMAKYMKTGTIEFRNKYEPRYGDVTGEDFQIAMNIVADARAMFLDLPSHVRERFDNDPAQFLDFVGDKANYDEARELGLLSVPPLGEGGGSTPPPPNAATANVANPQGGSSGEPPASKSA